MALAVVLTGCGNQAAPDGEAKARSVDTADENGAEPDVGAAAGGRAGERTEAERALPPSVTGKARRAEAVRRVATASDAVVEEVRVADPVTVRRSAGDERSRTVLRLRIDGEFHFGGQRIEVLLDDVRIGYAAEAADLRSVTVAVGDERLVRDGARVSYAYGSAPARSAGTLRMER